MVRDWPVERRIDFRRAAQPAVAKYRARAVDRQARRREGSAIEADDADEARTSPLRVEGP